MFVENSVNFGASPSRVAHELYEKNRWWVQLLQRFLSTFRMEHKNRVCIGMFEGLFLRKLTQNTE